VRAGEAEILPEEIGEDEAGFDLAVLDDAVDGELDLKLVSGHAASLALAAAAASVRWIRKPATCRR
jgi:hypothetical protein